MVDIEIIWSRLKEHEGEEFLTKLGKIFIYSLEGDIFQPLGINRKARKSDFIKALNLVPFDGPGVINKIAQCPAYIYSVLHDQRIRQSDW